MDCGKILLEILAMKSKFAMIPPADIPCASCNKQIVAGATVCAGCGLVKYCSTECRDAALSRHGPMCTARSAEDLQCALTFLEKIWGVQKLYLTPELAWMFQSLQHEPGFHNPVLTYPENRKWWGIVHPHTIVCVGQYLRSRGVESIFEMAAGRGITARMFNVFGGFPEASITAVDSTLPSADAAFFSVQRADAFRPQTYKDALNDKTALLLSWPDEPTGPNAAKGLCVSEWVIKAAECAGVRYIVVVGERPGCDMSEESVEYLVRNYDVNDIVDSGFVIGEGFLQLWMHTTVYVRKQV